MTAPFTKIGANGQGDLQQALGRTTCYSHIQLVGDVNQNSVAVGAVNKWAKYKPVKNTGITYESQLDTDKTWKSTADWWKASNGRCGLSFTTSESLYTGSSPFASGSFLRKLKDWDSSMVWAYDRPVSGTNPLRAYDFIQYYAAAQPPVIGVADNLRVFSNGEMTVQLYTTRGAHDLALQLDDLNINNSAVSGWYLGVLVYVSDSQFAFAFSTDTLGNGADSVLFTSMTGYSGRNATVVPFLSSVRANQGVNPGAGTFLSCDVAPQTFNISAQATTLTASIDEAIWTSQLHARVSYIVKINNNTGSTRTVNNLVIALSDGLQNIGTRSIGTVSVPQGSLTYEGTFIVDPYVSTRTYTLNVTSSTTGVSASKVVDAPRN
ncbi:MAG: hypothetical protein J6T35_03570 [Bacteroidales bacterium]|nr:hypothetical protein [Bacteroidales bacterium]